MHVADLLIVQITLNPFIQTLFLPIFHRLFSTQLFFLMDIWKEIAIKSLA